MKKIILLFVCGATIGKGFSQIYQQAFSTNTATITNGVITDAAYVGEPPSATQLSYLAAPTSGTIGVSSGALQVTQTSTSSRWAGVREQSNATTGLMKIKFDANITVGSSGTSAPKFVAYVGSGLSNNASMDANTNIHSGFGIKYQNSGYYYVNTLSGTNVTTQFTEGVSRTFTFIANGAVDAQSYLAPDGSIENVGNGKWDLWVDNVKVFDDQNATTSSQSLKSFKFGDINGSNGRADMVIDNFSFTELPVTLPVSLSSFKAITKANTIELNWTCLNESNVDRYEVEKSLNGINFEKIGSVAARNITTTQKYSFTDASPFAGTNLYRLKSFDKDGRYQYSSVLKVSKASKAEIMVAPNPVVGHHLNLQLNQLEKGTYSLRIVGANGQLVFSKNINVDNGSAVHDILLPASVLTGNYLLHLSKESSQLRLNITVQ